MKGAASGLVNQKQHLLQQPQKEKCACKKVKEALIDLYIEVKVRNEVSIKNVTNETLAKEKDNLRYLDSMDLIEYLRSSIEILLSLNIQGAQSNLDQPQLTTPSVQCNTSILNRNIPSDDEDFINQSGNLSNIEIPSHRAAQKNSQGNPDTLQLTTAIKQQQDAKITRHQRKQQLVNPNSIMNAYPKQGGQILNTESSTHTIVVKDSLCESSSNEEDFDDLDEDHNTIAEAPQFASGRKETSSISESVNGLVPQQYEEMIQKLERDIRQHIAFENQLRIHIENMTTKQEEQDACIIQLNALKEEEQAQFKREKRRLDDLLTIRENEIMQIKKLIESERAGFNERFEKLENKYQKQITKIRDEFIKAKPSSTSQQHQPSAQQSISISKSTCTGQNKSDNNQLQQAFFGSATIDLNSMMSRQQQINSVHNKSTHHRPSHSQEKTLVAKQQPSHHQKTNSSSKNGRSSTSQGFTEKPMFTSFQVQPSSQNFNLSRTNAGVLEERSINREINEVIEVSSALKQKLYDIQKAHSSGQMDSKNFKKAIQSMGQQATNGRNPSMHQNPGTQIQSKANVQQQTTSTIKSTGSSGSTGNATQNTAANMPTHKRSKTQLLFYQQQQQQQQQQVSHHHQPAQSMTCFAGLNQNQQSDLGKENVVEKRKSTNRPSTAISHAKQGSIVSAADHRKSSNQSSTSRTNGTNQRQQSAKGVREYLEEMLQLKHSNEQIQSMARQANSSIQKKKLQSTLIGGMQYFGNDQYLQQHQRVQSTATLYHQPSQSQITIVPTQQPQQQPNMIMITNNRPQSANIIKKQQNAATRNQLNNIPSQNRQII